MFTYPIGTLSKKGVQEILLVTMTPTAGFTVGFNLEFTGNVYIDFKDGGGPELLTSTVEKTHLYASASTYIAEITGNTSSITKFLADTSRITTLSNFKTGSLTDLRLNSNLLTGNLDLSNTHVSGRIELQSNTFSSITFATTGNGLSIYTRLNNNASLTAVDFSNIPLSGLLDLYNDTSLTSLVFATSGNGAFLQLHAYNCSLGYTDFTNISLEITNANFRYDNNSLSATNVNHILVDLDLISTGSYTGRVINIAGTNAAPDGTSGGYDGLTAKANLIAKGFNVITN